MKLAFKVSQSTNLDYNTIKNNALSVLELKKYRLVKITDNSVQFDESPWKLMWNFEAMKRFDAGEFQINVADGQGSVTLSYYVKLTTPLIAVAIISIFPITDGDYYAPLFFLTFFAVSIAINCLILKGIAAEMLNQVLS